MILVVDDYRDAGQALCRLLRMSGYPCEMAASGAEALEFIRGHASERPLLVVLDEMMPQMTGIDVLRAIRNDPAIAKTHVLFFSAGSDLASRDQAMTLGAVAWILKGSIGTDVERVLQIIRQWYERIGGVPTRAKPPSQPD